MRRALAILVACAAWTAVPAAGMTGMTSDASHVSIGYAAYVPASLQALTGETISWTNDSVRNHTVTADDNSFDSGVLPLGGSYSRAFSAPGTYGYYCRLHAGIVGTVSVHDVLLDPVAGSVVPGRPFPLRGRAAPGISSVTIEADSGSGFAPVTTATVGDDGTFSASVSPALSTTYRARTATDTSPSVALLVLDRTVTVGAVTHRGRTWNVPVTVAPALPGGRVVLQLKLRERFGWWPSASGRLDATSHAVLHLRRRPRAPARVVLTLPDGATPQATSRTFSVGG